MEETILQCAVVDDSTLQRLAIIKMIKDHPYLNLAAQYANAVQTKKGLKETKIDLLFLDIEMPILSGFDLLDELTHKPQIIFVTGMTKYAYEAFNYNAVDYLRKPITKDRFLNAVDKALKLHKTFGEGSLDENDYIFVKSNLKKQKVMLNNLKYVEALGDYIKLVTYTEQIVVLSTMKAFVDMLPTDRFMRVHKSFIINLDKIENYNSKFIEIEGEQIPLSRHKKASLKEALENKS